MGLLAGKQDEGDVVSCLLVHGMRDHQSADDDP
jgi:hypothetical protein